MKSLITFAIPSVITGTENDRTLGKSIVSTWQQQGIFQVALTDEQSRTTQRAFSRSKLFFGRSLEEKSGFVSESTYSGYIASQEEQTDGEPDYSEIFTICQDISKTDRRYLQNWPCHGPVPWPDNDYRDDLQAFMEMAGEIGNALLRLTALGLGLPIDAITDLTHKGWHHMRVLRFQKAEEHTSRGIGAHTDYGLLVIAAQLGADGLDIRPPLTPEGHKEKRKKNWIPGQSMAGEYKNDAHWRRVPLRDNVLTVFPGDLLQYISGDILMATPHKVALHPQKERYAIAYFHEPNFEASLTPLVGTNIPERVHYGRHFTDIFMRCYPQKPTTLKIIREGHYALLDTIGKS